MKKALNFLAVILLLLVGCSKEKPVADVQENNLIPEHHYSRLKSTGTDHGYFWMLYRDGGSGSITFPQAETNPGNFQITYSGVNDIIGGKGWNPGSSGIINYNIGTLSGNYNFVGVYGWTTNPLIEYYITEKGSMATGTYLGTMSSDGHIYSVYKRQRVNMASIIGTATYWQYLDTWGGASVGKSGKVTVDNHINNWKNRAGQGFGTFNYQIFALEAFGGGKSGFINATVW